MTDEIAHQIQTITDGVTSAVLAECEFRIAAFASFPADVGAPVAAINDAQWTLVQDAANGNDVGAAADPLEAHVLSISVGIGSGRPTIHLSGVVGWQPVCSHVIDTGKARWDRQGIERTPDEIRDTALRAFAVDLADAFDRMHAALERVPHRVTRFLQRLREDFGDPGDDPAYEMGASGAAREKFAHWLSQDGPRYLVCVGMGCSGVVSYIFKSVVQQTFPDLPLVTWVIPDYHVDEHVPPAILNDEERTCIVLFSHCGLAPEIREAYAGMKARKNLVFVTKNEHLMREVPERGQVCVRWTSDGFDHEYPLYHVTYFLRGLLSLFTSGRDIPPLLGRDEFSDVFRLFNAGLERRYHDRGPALRDMARRIHGRTINLLVDGAYWNAIGSIGTMLFWEVAMTPVVVNFLHDYTHSQVAACDSPLENQALLVVTPGELDAITESKMRIIEREFASRDIPIEYLQAPAHCASFLDGFLSVYFDVAMLAGCLGLIYQEPDHELISVTSMNMYYNAKTIDRMRQDPTFDPHRVHALP